MVKKSDAEYKRAERKRRREAGQVFVGRWVPREKRALVVKIIDVVTRAKG